MIASDAMHASDTEGSRSAQPSREAEPARASREASPAPRLYLRQGAPPLQIVLVHPQIPPNTGNVARLCAVTGTRLHLVAPLGFRITDKDLRRAGLDYWDKVHAATWSSFDELLETERLGEGSRMHLLTSHAGQARPLWEVRFHPGDWLVFGEEARGLPDEILSRFPSSHVRVPMIAEPSARSLNLATCAGVVLYEALRQCAPDPVEDVPAKPSAR
jgi:tRNA (cytidine/uridine-2'-O-)-methyltransferase